MENQIIRKCAECNLPLYGRADKRFCDDSCRNNYNNRQNSDQISIMRNINNTLRKNRRILKSYLGEQGVVRLKRIQLLQAGFSFQFFTHHYTNDIGQLYYFNYEYGYSTLNVDMMLIVKKEWN